MAQIKNKTTQSYFTAKRKNFEFNKDFATIQNCSKNEN